MTDREIIDCIKEVGFSLSVIAADTVDIGRKIQLLKSNIAEI